MSNKHLALLSKFRKEAVSKPHCASLQNDIAASHPVEMITKRQIEIHRKYAGLIDGIYHLSDKEAQALFDNNSDWSVISNLFQDIYLIENNVCSQDFKEKTLKQIELTVDKEALPMLWTTLL